MSSSPTLFGNPPTRFLTPLVAPLLLLFFALPATADVVKLSNSGICHDSASRWYERTKRFVAHDSMEECLRFGRAYKGYSGSISSSRESGVSSGSGGTGVNVATARPYDRELYDHWIDADGDCQNARHELLQELSTGPVTLTASGCTVAHGRWNDPYTGFVFTNAREMDIDHLVPLAWAHARGADLWDSDLRRRFANDPVNLFAVQASVNRSKGAQGPLEWLPPNEAFRCQYVTRFHRVALSYGLTYPAGERERMDALRQRLCG